MSSGRFTTRLDKRPAAISEKKPALSSESGVMKIPELSFGERKLEIKI